VEREIIELFMRHLKLQGDLPLGDDAGAIKWESEWLVVTNDMLVRTTDVPDIMTPEQVNEACDLIIDGIALGKTKRLLTRSSAKIRDLVCVTGDIGRALAGLKVYFESLEVGERTRKVLYEKLLEPKARVKEGVVLGRYANSAIDISDGMSKELHLIAKMSGVKILIDSEKLPIRKEVFEVADLLGLDPIEIALASGEEFELIFTIPEKHLDKLDFDFAVIGRVEKGEGVYLRRYEKIEKMPILGWEHLSKF